jgi:hypothetical protein
MHRIEGVYLFPAPISVDGTVFGTTYHVTIGGVDATLSLPRRRPEWATQSGLAGDLLPPVARLPALARDYDKTVEWAWDISRWGGVMQWPDGYGYVTSGLLAVEFSTAGDPADAGRERAGRIGEALAPWFESACDWLAALSRMPMGHRDPRRQVQRRRLRLDLLDSGGKRIDCGPPAIFVRRLDQNPALTSAVHWSRALREASAGNSLHLAHVALNWARLAAAREQYARAVAEAGIAADVALAEALDRRLRATKSAAQIAAMLDKAALGRKEILATTYGVPIPASLGSDLREVRNDVLHRAATPSPAQAYAAIAVTEQVLRDHVPL